MIGRRTLGTVFFKTAASLPQARPSTALAVPLSPLALAPRPPAPLAVVERCRRRHPPAERRHLPPASLAALARAADVTVQVAMVWREGWDAVRPRCRKALERAALSYRGAA